MMLANVIFNKIL